MNAKMEEIIYTGVSALGKSSALALPHRFKLTASNAALAKKIGVIFDGCYRYDVMAYDLEAQTIVVRKGKELETLKGQLEVYWR